MHVAVAGNGQDENAIVGLAVEGEEQGRGDKAENSGQDASKRGPEEGGEIVVVAKGRHASMALTR